MNYIIKKGHHYASQRPFIPFFRDELKFTLRFDGSAIYDPVKTDYDHSYDVNKAYGFREGFTDRNSARIGWSYTDGCLLLYPYVHIEGMIWNKTNQIPICEAQINKEIECRIKCFKAEYFFDVNGVTKFAPRGHPCFLKFICHPYFGGTLTAPHDIKIVVHGK